MQEGRSLCDLAGCEGTQLGGLLLLLLELLQTCVGFVYLGHLLIDLESGCEGSLLGAQSGAAQSALYQSPLSTDDKRPILRLQAIFHRPQGLQ